jgi:hypothetical protein
MPVILERAFQPISTAVAAVGYRHGYGVVIRYKTTGEFVAPHWGLSHYLRLRLAASVGHTLAQMRTGNSDATFLPVEGTHFTTFDRWVGETERFNRQQFGIDLGVLKYGK